MFQFKFKGRKMPIPAPGSEAGGILIGGSAFLFSLSRN